MAYCVLGTILGAKKKAIEKTAPSVKTVIPLSQSHLIPVTVWGSCYSYHHLTDEETELQRIKYLIQ